MSRVHDRVGAEALAQALMWIPTPLHPLVACDVVIGVDPVFAGVHRYTATHDGRSYRDTSHVVYPFHQDHRPAADRTVKLVVPAARRYHSNPVVRAASVVHELGHVLDHTLGFSHTAAATTDYAHTDRYEAFAEAFRLWVWGEPVDDGTSGLLEGLAG